MRILFLVLKLPLAKQFFSKIYLVKDKRLERRFFGLTFPNPVGLAAGFDKDGKFFETISCLGFGFVEIGTVTPVAQIGNPQPRLFRLVEDEGIINRMGFNNDGVEAMVHRLQKRKNSQIIIGGNIGKNKTTPNENAHDDYLKCFESLFPYVDYFVVNVSSPNTPNLRTLQEKKPLLNILNLLQEKNRQYENRKPILLKIAPDLGPEQLDDIVDIVTESKIDGIIATNTTISREKLTTDANTVQSIGTGGLSGAPLRDRSTEVISYLHKKSQGDIPIIGVGGITSPQDAIEKLAAGASLVQVYSGLIYTGPNLVKDINREILRYLSK